MKLTIRRKSGEDWRIERESGEVLKEVAADAVWHLVGRLLGVVADKVADVVDDTPDPAAYDTRRGKRERNTGRPIVQPEPDDGA